MANKKEDYAYLAIGENILENTEICFSPSEITDDELCGYVEECGVDEGEFIYYYKLVKKLKVGKRISLFVKETF